MDRRWLLIVALSLAVVFMTAGGLVRSRPAVRRKKSGWALTCLGLGIALTLMGMGAFLPHPHGSPRISELSARTVLTGVGCAGLGLILAGLYLGGKAYVDARRP